MTDGLALAPLRGLPYKRALFKRPTDTPGGKGA